MSQRKVDRRQRFRSKTVGIRMSPEENAELDRFVAVCGMTKQDYCIDRLLQRDVVVRPNAMGAARLASVVAPVVEELSRLSDCSEMEPELREVLEVMGRVVGGAAAQGLQRGPAARGEAVRFTREERAAYLPSDRLAGPRGGTDEAVR